jgi:hypothetical protein
MSDYLMLDGVKYTIDYISYIDRLEDDGLWLELEVTKERPYSQEDYQKATTQGLDLDNWKDYQTFYGLGESA